MKYLKNFESLRDEYPGMIPKEEIENVPGFENGTIDPEDDYEYEVDGIKQRDSDEYKKFLKIVKERNFEETDTEIKINLRGIGHDYCMSIFNYTKHLVKFLNDELVGKYVTNGFQNILTDKNIEGIIKNVDLIYHDEDCTNLFTLKLKNVPHSDNNGCNSHITIDKLKSKQNIYNL